MPCGTVTYRYVACECVVVTKVLIMFQCYLEFSVRTPRYRLRELGIGYGM